MTSPDWAQDALFYHIYPLGMCGAPWRNDFQAEPEPRLNLIHDWASHLGELGVNAVYIGPLWEAGSHGYHTVSYWDVDRRLGSQATLQNLVRTLHRQLIRVVLDAVFNHVGREFFAFRSLRRLGKDSPYVTWFEGLRFDKRSAHGDPFWYEGWKGHYDLAKLNVHDPEVRQHLLEAVRHWIEAYEIDGLRLDAADCLDKDFLAQLNLFCRRLKPDFWLMGEVVIGDYSSWGLDAVTNYELYDSLHKAHNEQDYTRLAATLDRQYGSNGQYRAQPLYNFADNHDVNRIASLLKRSSHLYPLHILLLTLPGIPSLYYGSEAGFEGKRLRWSDRPLRPFLPHPRALQDSRHRDLLPVVKTLAGIRHQHPLLRSGSYRTLHAEKQLLVFARRQANQEMVVAVNMGKEAGTIPLDLPGRWRDLLNPRDSFSGLKELKIYPHWGRILAAAEPAEPKLE
ncbi:MAG: alpha-amylase family glycosyl hydrolase [Candidatus Sericytochromatia bacterium]